MRREIYKFNGFLLDSFHRKLSHKGSVISLSPRAYEILLLLIENKGSVVEKNEILAAVWTDSFVEESNLAVHISALRRVLGEKRGEQRFIETISGRGYSFVAQVGEVSTNSENIHFEKLNPTVFDKTSAATPISIAVLPITHKEPDADFEYLANGITQSLIDSLSHIPKLKVMAYGAVAGYIDASSDLKETGFLLDVDNLLIGNISEYKNNLEISVELVKAVDKSYLWGTQYVCELGDFFQVRKEISLAIAEKLQLRLDNLDENNLAKQSSKNSEAYKQFLKGMHLLNGYASSNNRGESLNAALNFFQQALKIDPNYASAYAVIGRIYFLLFRNDFLDHAEAHHKCQTAFRLAFNLDEHLSDTFVLKGIIELFFEQNLGEAESAWTKAINLNPNNPYAYHWLSHLLVGLGKFDESISFQNKAIELDPTSTGFNYGLITRFFFSENYNQAIIQAEETLELNERFAPAHELAAASLALSGIYAEALKNIEKAIAIHPSPEYELTHAYIYALSGERKRAGEILNRVLTELDNVQQSFADIAAVYQAVGDESKTFEYLEKGVEFKGTHCFLLRVDPRFKNLRHHPKFVSLLETLDIK